MAGEISGLTALASGHAAGDLIEILDISDTTMSANGTNKKTTLANLFGNVPTPILSAADGTVSAVAVGRSTSPGTGMYFNGGNQVALAANGVNVVVASSATGVWNPSLQHSGWRVKVSASTAGSGAPAAIDITNDGFTIMTNEGATAQNYRTLPTAAAGYVFWFAAQDADGIRINAAAGDTIRDLASVSAAAGRIETTTIGSTLCLASINATEWIVMFKTGTWTVT